ncbi:tRNA (N(6)-L-threonylcarbamoyladenosine(37)-C(2))-methylthiotransferase MtaB [Hyphomicrobiales bacterium]|jgi:threonylcarbamoyladenosine tRNA methylthiotransferase MtaB|nr:tRNA (N(6)-L-threonylcarbamoyladenosine(37)-C(2))-methylthiotransferase MtaB [Hyphomicrobiales bacterium]MDB4831468.1 tRNA (N(6)-L-threonylcarbamoyladenosine(37)-C(2))-methylthiotransferase MtaB [Hyphomicrobiales bacterium]MDC0139347.1 tRNA (N(6)-L-threonylcarbamoyladenosine(37)-C(2))-methylthiotransferase MtaB [Hyphomicrobiales bacterium]MDC3272895.1 tRNA (N(6)-L-threonylcarbamoyladenosine(37)-C(2))-methylthiotransferase MtaB [Hyphomicrobiales bacterium]
MNEKNLDFITFGCKLNMFESEIMREKAIEHGLENITFFNTCAVTNEAIRQARQRIRKEKRNYPNKRIIVTGCAAQLHPEEFNEMDEVDFIIGNQEKTLSKTYEDLKNNILSIPSIKVTDIMEVRETSSHLLKSFGSKTRAFVEVQNGCDHRCTFCIIPYARGNSRSVPANHVIKQIKNLVATGYSEIVLTGVDITSYGKGLDDNINLSKLIALIIKDIPDLKRLRISSIDSIEIDQEFIDIFVSEKKIMPHLHLSIQSGDNLILKRMKRRHLAEHTLEFCQKIRELRGETVFGADIITGFPTETDEMFKNTKEHIDNCNLTYLHIFPFSAKKGTPAEKMPQIQNNIIKKRATELRKLGSLKLDSFLEEQIGQSHEILVEKNGFGRTEQYCEVNFNGNYNQGEIITGLIKSVNQNKLNAEII